MSINLEPVSSPELRDRTLIDVNTWQIYYVNSFGQTFLVNDLNMYSKILENFKRDGISHLLAPKLGAIFLFNKAKQFYKKFLSESNELNF